MTQQKSEHEKVFDLLSSFSTAMMVTRCDQQHLRARPMQVAKLEPSGRIWFITADHSAKVHEIEENTRVELIFQKDQCVYLSVGGTASIIKNHGKIKELWKEPYRLWFPLGADDPNIVLISVIPDRVEYWDQHGFNKLEYYFDAAVAYFRGRKLEVEEGEFHGVVTM